MWLASWASSALRRASRPIHCAWIILAVLAGCVPAAAPVERLHSSPAEIAAPLPTQAPPLSTHTPTALPTQAPTPTSTAAPPAFAEPAGCREPLPGEPIDARLAYAAKLAGLAGRLESWRMDAVWNQAAQRYERTGEEVMAFSIRELSPGYRLQEAANALFVSGLIPWLRKDPERQPHLLAIPLRPGVLESSWGEYVRAYFAGPLTTPDQDSTVVPMMHLTPCDWMVRAGYTAPKPAGELEMASWKQPDFAAAGEGFLAETTEEAFRVAYQIDWQPGGDIESPNLMCGPLTWAITAQAGAFPPGYGDWSGNPTSFWLPDPEDNGRPWNLFPKWSYTVFKKYAPIQDHDFKTYPLETGDMVYTYALWYGFDHILVVTEKDAEGAAYSVTNIIRRKPVKEFAIRRTELYSPADPKAGIYFNQWATDVKNGRTGQRGYEIFRWTWREKDILGRAARYTVQAGDTLALIAARWRTPPEIIAAANGADRGWKLAVGEEITIPPNPPQ